MSRNSKRRMKMFDYLSIPPLRSLCGMWKRVVRVFSRELLLHKQVLTMRRRKETQPSTQRDAFYIVNCLLLFKYSIIFACSPDKSQKNKDAQIRNFNPSFALQADQELRSYGPATELTGSTATVAMVRRGELVCANLGDSRAVASVRLAFKQHCRADAHHVRHRASRHNVQTSSRVRGPFALRGCLAWGLQTFLKVCISYVIPSNLKNFSLHNRLVISRYT